MAREARALRNKSGNVDTIAFSDSILPISAVHEKVDKPIECRLQTRGSAYAPKGQRRFEKGNFYLHPNGSIIDETVETSVKCMLGADIILHAGVKIEDAKIHPGVELGEGVIVNRRTEIQESSFIGNSTKIIQSIIGFGSYIGASSDLRLANLGPNCKTGDNASIDRTTVSGSLTAGNNLELIASTLSSQITLGDNFKAGAKVTLKDNVKFGRYALLGDNIRVATGVSVGEFCAIDDSVTIDNEVRIARYVEIGKLSRLDVSAALLDNTILEDEVYIGPFMEISGQISKGAYVAYRKQPIPIWPIPIRTFVEQVEKNK